ncbi:FAD-binding domain-containing protein [Panaeolus papilionaceus]|nr:FAD-binding domain-containing protein [Panaeolus papilionaceus]
MIKSASLLLLIGEVAYVAAVSSSNWKALNQTLNGRLQLAVPVEQPCFSVGAGGSSLTPDPTACNNVQTHTADHLFRSDNFGAYELAQWETCQTTGDQCLLDGNNPFNPAAFSPPRQCTIGNIPPYFIDVQSAADVQAAIKFVSKNNVPLVVKNTGHDYKGRSAGIGSLALWTHHLNQLQFKPTFVPEKCSATPVTAITMGAGAQFADIYAFATQNNVTFVGGADPSVGASGGWVMGGGHSALTPSLGMGVDRVLEFKIVTADGQLRTANKCQNPDLFFALRGGGGGTFGVVLESTHLVTPQVTLQVVLGQYNNTKDNSKQLIKALAKTAVKFASDGWGGYITPPAGSGVWINPLVNSQQAQQSAADVIQAFQSVGGNVTFFTMPNFEEWYNTFILPNPDPIGLAQALASRIIDDTKMADDNVIEAVADGLLDSDFSQILAVPPYAFKNFDPTATSVNPKWRTGIWHTAMIVSWNFDATIDDRVQQYQRVTKLWNPVRALTPGAAVYQNEADVYEPDHEVGYWGTNFAKLVTIKNKYDPKGIFDCWHCVGWKGPQDPRYQCYPKTS